MKGEVITHRAKVIHVADNYVDVVVLSESACASCHAKGYCGAAESREKRMVIETPLASYFSAGEEVEVYTETVMGIKAVCIAYILPFLLVLFLLLVLLRAGCGELISGVSALSVLVVYYVILYVARSRLSREFVFKVRKLNQQKL